MPKFDWKPFFPYKNVRPGQELAIDDILDAFEAGKKYFVLDAGTGVGKSAIAATVAEYIEKYILPKEDVACGTNILTTQKLLQDQYRHDYPYINSLKSSTNYQCTFHKTQSCNESRKMFLFCIRSEFSERFQRYLRIKNVSDFERYSRSTRMKTHQRFENIQRFHVHTISQRVIQR